MKSFPLQSNFSAADCARDGLDVVTLVMHAPRTKMRRRRAGLSVPHFPTLTFVRNNSRASLSAVAEHVGLTLPSVSKLVDGLVERKLVSRASGSASPRPASPRLTRPLDPHLARDFRHPSTPAEAKLWKVVRKRQLGFGLRRQHTIGRLVVDYCCAEARLATEIDGDAHAAAD